jgi:hypothetical protein
MSKKQVKVTEDATTTNVPVEAAPVEAAPVEAAPVENEGSDIAKAISEGLKSASEKNFSLQPDAGVLPRFTVVKNKQGEVMLRENETGRLSQVQLKSIEEKESSIQGQEVEEA